MTENPTAEQLRRRLDAFRYRPVLVAIIFQVIALALPYGGLIVIAMMLFWLFVTWSARVMTTIQIRELERRERQAEADAREFIHDRQEQIRQRMQSMLEAEARARFRRNGATEMFRGNCIDVTEKH